MQKNNRAGGAKYQDRIQTQELEDMFGVTSFIFPYIDWYIEEFEIICKTESSKR